MCCSQFHASYRWNLARQLPPCTSSDRITPGYHHEHLNHQFWCILHAQRILRLVLHVQPAAFQHPRWAEASKQKDTVDLLWSDRNQTHKPSEGWVLSGYAEAASKLTSTTVVYLIVLHHQEGKKTTHKCYCMWCYCFTYCKTKIGK